MIETINTNAPMVQWLVIELVIVAIATLVARKLMPSSWSKVWMPDEEMARIRVDRAVPWDPESVRVVGMPTEPCPEDDEVTIDVSIPTPPSLPSDWEATSGVRTVGQEQSHPWAVGDEP